MTQTPMMENRVFVAVSAGANGSTVVKLTAMQPAGVASIPAVLRSRGHLTQDLAFTIPRAANDGANATSEQVATAVAAYLAAHPPAAGQDATPTQIAAAVASYMTANPVPTLSKAEWSINLIDAYAAGLAAGGDSKRIACSGLKTTDAITVQPLGVLPSGYMIGAPSCTENGWVRIGFVRPLLAIGAANTIPLKVVALR